MAECKQVDVAALIESQQASWFRISIVIWSCLVMLIEGYDIQVLAYAAPSIIKSWQINPSYFGPIFGVSLFGYMLGATLISNLADRIGRKKIILGGVLLFGVFNFLSAYAHALDSLFVLRLIAGVGLGASIPSTIALTVEYFPARTRATIVGVMFLGYTLGATLGGFIAASLIPTFGWQSVFYVGGICPLLIAAVLFFTLPESVRFLALTRNQNEKVASILAKLRPDLMIESSVGFVIHEEKQAGIPVGHLFMDGRARITVLLWLAYITSLLGHYFLTSWLPTLLVGTGMKFGHAVIAGGLLQGGGGFGGLLLCWLLDKKGIMAIAVAFVLSAPLIALIAASSRVSDFVVMVLVFITGMCLVGGQVGLNAISGTFYPTYIRSTGVGWALGVGRVGSILGPVLGGMLISFNLPITVLFACAAVPALCCAGATYFMGRTPTPVRPADSLAVP